MAELTPRERLQPSLLDRLVDDDPTLKRDPAERRLLSLERLRACVLRDLEWLLNTGNLAVSTDLSGYELVAHSVLNYGIPVLAGRTATSIDVSQLEEMLKQAILDFEPRILARSLNVRAVVHADVMSRNTVSFEIEGELWAHPVPLSLLLKTEIDLESGHVAIEEQRS